MNRYVLVALLLHAGAATAAASLAGTWRGVATLAGDTTPVEVVVSRCTAGACGSWRMPELGYAGMIAEQDRDDSRGGLRAGPLELALDGVALVGKAGGSHAFFLDAAGHGERADVRLVRAAEPPRTSRLVPIAFRHGEVELAGTLVLPRGEGPFPTLVHVHGSGPSTRWPALGRAYRFAEHGIASLIYDKRGNGGSTGDWTAASLDDLAGDAAAALAHARSLRDVDRSRVGFWAHSQGGWVVPRAVALGARAAFAILVAGGALSPAAIERHDYAAAVERIEPTPDERRAASELVDAYLGYLGGELSEAEIRARMDAASGTRWSRALGLSRVLPSATARDKWAWVASYDPVPDLAALGVPLLFIVGGDDRPALRTKLFEQLDRALRGAPASRTRVVYYPQADHHLRVRNGPGWARAPADVDRMQAQWLLTIDRPARGAGSGS